MNNSTKPTSKPPKAASNPKAQKEPKTGDTTSQKKPRKNPNDVTREIFEFDKSFALLLAGCDEAGRGSLAGPVVCATCIMPLDTMISGIFDSKQIPEKNRELLFEEIISKAIAYKASVISSEVIDKINILAATKQGMSEAINGLKIKPDLVLIDAVNGIKTDLECKPIIKGDAKSYNIAAASIIAKVTRDRIMRELDKTYPNYGFCKNKGYATAQHIAALRQHGATEIHRKLFVRTALTEQLQFDLNI